MVDNLMLLPYLLSMHILKIFRDQIKVSQASLAKIIGVRQATISRWESGEMFPHRETAYKIIKLAKDRRFQITFHELMGGPKS